MRRIDYGIVVRERKIFCIVFTEHNMPTETPTPYGSFVCGCGTEYTLWVTKANEPVSELALVEIRDIHQESIPVCLGCEKGCAVCHPEGDEKRKEGDNS